MNKKVKDYFYVRNKQKILNAVKQVASNDHDLGVHSDQDSQLPSHPVLIFENQTSRQQLEK